MDPLPACVVCTPTKDLLRYIRIHSKGGKEGKMGFTACLAHDKATFDRRAQEITQLAGLNASFESEGILVRRTY